MILTSFSLVTVSIIVLLTVIILHLCLIFDLTTLIQYLRSVLDKKVLGNKPSPISTSSIAGRRARRTERKKIWKSHEKVADNFVLKDTEKILEYPCHGCGKTNAKRNCTFHCCATCCRQNKNMCHGHGTCHSIATFYVESARENSYVNFDLSYNGLKRCPPGVSGIGDQLVSLNLSNNQLHTLPEDIGCLINLEELFLQYNCLTVLPDTLCFMTKLIELDVKNNALSSLPNAIGNMKRLQILNLTNNSISQLPTSIGGLRELEELSIHCNNLSELPNEVCNLRNIRIMYAGENNFKTLPRHFGRLVKLEELDVSSCAIVYLPESLSECRSLVRLWISNNRLSTLPHHIGQLQKLKELHVRNNIIKYFPASIQKLQLYTFTAQNNKLIKENAARLMFRNPLELVPPLIELAARSVLKYKVPVQHGCIPQHLEDVLVCNYLLTCYTCEQALFYHFFSAITFETVGSLHTIGISFRVPLFCTYCSEQCIKYVW